MWSFVASWALVIWFQVFLGALCVSYKAPVLFTWPPTSTLLTFNRAPFTWPHKPQLLFKMVTWGLYYFFCSHLQSCYLHTVIKKYWLLSKLELFRNIHSVGYKVSGSSSTEQANSGFQGISYCTVQSVHNQNPSNRFNQICSAFSGKNRFIWHTNKQNKRFLVKKKYFKILQFTIKIYVHET